MYGVQTFYIGFRGCFVSPTLPWHCICPRAKWSGLVRCGSVGGDWMVGWYDGVPMGVGGV